MKICPVTKKGFTERITKREDNHSYKYEMVREIINMYNEELRKALMNGESINIGGVGSIVPKVRYKETYYTPPNIDDNFEQLPFVDVRFHKSVKLKDAINSKLSRCEAISGKCNSIRIY